MPETNRTYLRLYGHYMCPFVERVRLVLAARNIPYQDCQVNLERRAKWHYELNGGFVPILQLPSGEVVTESSIIMGFLAAITGDEDFASAIKGRIITHTLVPKEAKKIARQ